MLGSDASCAKQLERQAATDEVLRVIASSTGELEPVFETILANATRICEATFGNLFLREGDALRAVAVHGPPGSYVEWYRREPVKYSLLVMLHRFSNEVAIVLAR
jgi:hypothetical protein